MTMHVILRRGAEDDVWRAFEWYQSEREGLGEEFLAQLRQTLDRIAAYPNSYSEVYRSVRRAPLRKFPYLVFYLGERDRIVVLAVLHTSRDPRRWPRR
jgi:plasmid stabilization system protein ParE